MCAFVHAVKDRGCHLSMDGRGAWRENVFVERLWKSVKYEQVVRVLGDRHEKSHLGTFPKVVDLSKANQAEREQRTLEEVKKKPLSFIKVDSGRKHGLRAWIVKS